MNNLYDRDSDLQDSNPGEREISLGTSTVLGIFFALALICAVFFGFGYSMGRRSAQPLASTATEPITNAGLNSSKPTPASLLPVATQQPAASDTATPTPDTDTVAVPDTQPEAATPQPAARQVALTRATPPPPVAAPTPGTATAMVQVAAVSHKEDADLLLSALKKRGYTVAVRQEPQDKLLHVQLGPFASKKEADAMRQRLLTDGYNAIVK